MTAPLAISVFRTRCEACAMLVAVGERDFIETADRMHNAAVAYGLIDEFGQDRIQEIMAAAFGTAKLPHSASFRPQEPQTADIRSADSSTVDALMYELRAGVTALSRNDTCERVAALSEQQLRIIFGQLQNRNSAIAAPWSTADLAILMEMWVRRHG
jgi:hypothetical protein